MPNKKMLPLLVIIVFRYVAVAQPFYSVHYDLSDTVPGIPPPYIFETGQGALVISK
jgi:hypothetical protein